MKTYKKRDFPVEMIRRFLEPGPIVLVSSAWEGKSNIMAMGWYTVMEFSPSRIGCYISPGNHSFEMIDQSGECVINVPTDDLMRAVVKIGNSTGDETDKFREFRLTPAKAEKVSVPLIRECYANLECRVVDRTMVAQYNFFILEVLKAHAPVSPKYPRTIHYTGDGVFMISGRHVNLRRMFREENL